MSPAARIILGLACGFGTLGFLCAGLGGAGKDARANTLLIGLAAVSAVLAFYFATAKPAAKPKKRTRRPIAMPSAAADYEDESREAAPAPERPRKPFEMRDFDLANLTPAGWAFGLSGIALMTIPMIIFAVSMGETAKPDERGRGPLRLVGLVGFGVMMVYFTYGARWLAKQGYPVFRDGKTSAKRKKTARRPDEPSGLPPRRSPRGS